MHKGDRRGKRQGGQRAAYNEEGKSIHPALTEAKDVAEEGLLVIAMIQTITVILTLSVRDFSVRLHLVH